jgi:ComF family protein
VTIPVYRDRANWRGFNQAEEMGKIVAERLGLNFAPNLLIKKRKTRPQTGLDKEKRLENLQGALAINPHSLLSISHQPLIILDDVWTTGATLKEAAKVLKRKGARVVWGLTFARG